MAISAEQMRAAHENLARAQHVRLTNAATLRALREPGDMMACLENTADLLRHGDFTGPLGSVTVEGLLDRGVWGVNKRKAAVIAEDAGVGVMRLLGSLTVRQRHVLARVLDGRAAVIRHRRRYKRPAACVVS